MFIIYVHHFNINAISPKHQLNPCEWIILSVTINNSVAVTTHRYLLCSIIVVKHVTELMRFFCNQYLNLQQLWDAKKNNMCIAFFNANIHV